MLWSWIYQQQQWDKMDQKWRFQLQGVKVCSSVVFKSNYITLTFESNNVIFFGPAGFNFDTEDGDTVVPGFLDAIIGIQRGETKSFPLAFPDSWKQEDLRGLPCQFTVSFFI